MDIAHLEGEREVLACSEKTETLQSVNHERVIHKSGIAQKRGRPLSGTHFLLNLYIGFDLVGKL